MSIRLTNATRDRIAKAVLVHRFQEPVEALIAERALRNERIVEKMALEIIRLTSEFGQCTDAALRAEFGPLVAELSDVAVSRANEMADRGPFVVVALLSANAA